MGQPLIVPLTFTAQIWGSTVYAYGLKEADSEANKLRRPEAMSRRDFLLRGLRKGREGPDLINDAIVYRVLIMTRAVFSSKNKMVEFIYLIECCTACGHPRYCSWSEGPFSSKRPPKQAKRQDNAKSTQRKAMRIERPEIVSQWRRLSSADYTKTSWTVFTLRSISCSRHEVPWQEDYWKTWTRQGQMNVFAIWPAHDWAELASVIE